MSQLPIDNYDPNSGYFPGDPRNNPFNDLLPPPDQPITPLQLEMIRSDMESNPPVFGPPPFGQPPVFGPPGGQVPGGINYQNPFEFTDAINPYPDPLVGINPFPTIDPGANPFEPPTDDPYALPEQNPFPAIQPNPYLPPMPFQTPPINNTPFPDFAPVTFEPPPELPQGGFDPYQPVSGGPTTDPYGETLGQGTGGPADETIVTDPPPPPPPPEGSPYFMVDGERFNDRNAAIARARSLGDPGGLELFAADGTLISGRPQYTAEEREEQQRLAAERQAEFDAQREQNRQRQSAQNTLIEQIRAEDYQKNVNPDDFYYIDSGRLGSQKFANFEDAKNFLEKYNAAGEDISDVYDKSQRSMMPVSFRKIKSSAGTKMFDTANTADRHGEVFATRDEAVKSMIDQGLSRDRAERLVREFAEGGEVSNRLRISDIKRFKRGGAVGTFVERR